ncbi:general stress protein [Salisediminibacterium halotolerans]|uniref:general stress protein n=1 Tax=Salisediminibacterium halotolerans TaxID=517425 RepID=UPI000EB21E2D|nr:general stress protein [Salisediminibacterium halotolerans]RLJ73127.1 heat induced stress protein YflT [Actinophytocola xinjiangensis]RPE86549.1 heat induced stress protein YflT [Salisediminibacterium halotolerans]TWG33924.1 heat induced stress protein YflT [Salisediminibacterium halotolerans]GEL08677.1 general stress protein [Salisediminibacterium halotolerans]
MQPNYREFYDDLEVVDAVTNLKEKGVSPNNIYILTHDEERTKRVADNADANVIGLDEENIGTVAKNLVRKKGDELRARLMEIGFEDHTADELEDKLDQGKVLVILKDVPDGTGI